MTSDLRPLTLGWEEWVALPDLGLPALKAKIDTGARTSALHARRIEPFGPAAQPMVRFLVQPRPKKPEIEIVCAAPVAGRREVKSSNGETEQRYVVATTLAIAGRSWPIEITLSNRASMTFPMLIGRQALKDHAVVDPVSSCRQPRLGWRAYRKLGLATATTRPLRIAVLSGKPRAASNRRLAAAAAARGHVLEVLDPATLALVVEPDRPGLLAARKPLGHYDVVLARTRGGATARLVRQFQIMGAAALNGAASLTLAADTDAVAQMLAGAALPWRPRSRDGGPRIAVIGGRPVASTPAATAPGAAAAVRAARALGLDVAEVMFSERDGGIAAVTPTLSLTAYGRQGAEAIASAIVRTAEERVTRPKPAPLAAVD